MRRTPAACLAAAILLVLFPGASAHFDPAHGTVTVHASTLGAPTERVDACSFVVKGSGLTASSGEVVLMRVLGNETAEEALRGTWSGQSEGGGTYRFSATYVTTGGEYQVHVGVGPEADQGTPVHVVHTGVVVVNCGGAYLACPSGLTAVALATGGVRLQWLGVAGAESYAVYRTGPDGLVSRLGTTSATSYTDAATSPGVAYRYFVNAEQGLRESLKCPSATATAQGMGAAPPPGGSEAAAIGAAGAIALGGVGLLAALRRR